MGKNKAGPPIISGGEKGKSQELEETKRLPIGFNRSNPKKSK